MSIRAARRIAPDRAGRLSELTLDDARERRGCRTPPRYLRLRRRNWTSS
jgi:hypothetical protein